MSQSVMHLLGWLPTTERLKSSLDRAQQAAKRADHEKVTTAHVLASLLEDTDAVAFLARSGVDLQNLRDFCVGTLGEQPSTGKSDVSDDSPRPAPRTDKSTANQAANGTSTTSIQHGFRAAPGSHSAPSQPVSAPYGHGHLTAGYDASGAGYSGYGSPRPSEAPSFDGSSAGNGYAIAAHATSSYTAASGSDTSARTPSSWSRTSTADWGGSSDLYHQPASLDHASSGYRVAAQAAPAPTSQASQTLADAGPEPSRELRRMMARASEMAELDQRDVVTSEIVVRAIASDPSTRSGRHLRLLLGAPEPEAKAKADQKQQSARTPAEAEPADQKSKAEQQAKGREQKDKPAEPLPPAFDLLRARASRLQKLLERDLQRDYRYRLANDLETFVENRSRTGHAGRDAYRVISTALEVVVNAKGELSVDPTYRAFQQMLATSSAMLANQAQLRDEFMRLLAAKGYKDDHEIVRALRDLIDVPELPDPADFEPLSPSAGPETAASHFGVSEVAGNHADSSSAGSEADKYPDDKTRYLTAEEAVVDDLRDDEAPRLSQTRHGWAWYLKRMFNRGRPTSHQHDDHFAEADRAHEHVIDITPRGEPLSRRNSGRSQSRPRSHDAQPEQRADPHREQGTPAAMPIILMSGRSRGNESATTPYSNRTDREPEFDSGAPQAHRRNITHHIVWITVLVSATIGVGVLVQAAFASV